MKTEKHGQAEPEVHDTVENFCAMHLQCNLRKAFLSGTKTMRSSSNREHSSVGT